MCGIFATTGNMAETLVNDVLQSMHHRGPDEGKDIKLDNFHLGHRRLSIIGLHDGIQPIHNEDKSKWIVCNGEIYNYLTLKKEIKNNVDFLTESDSEVVLKIYEEEGIEGVRKLDGMFAFFIADDENNTFLAARDTLGIKPLYYGRDKTGQLLFSSELKTLYLVTDDVHEFPAGHYYTPETGFVCYRKIESPVNADIYDQQSLDKITMQINEELTSAVKKRLLADVEVGVLLSGGLDSSLISAIIANLNESGQPVKSFCVGSEDSEDLVRAREVAEAIGTEHHEYIYTKQELIDVLPKVIYHLESFEPSLVRSALPNYFVSKLAAQHVKVILSGEGADELFAGYDYLREFKDDQCLNHEVIRIINSLHNINLQRADRMSMAHSLELRVPFLDLELIEHALKIPAKHKLHTEERMEKWILRKSFDGLLPDQILWRKKEEFSAGSGALEILEQHANNTITDEAFKKLNLDAPIDLRSKQEALYYKIYKEIFPQASAIDAVGRWATA
ncbi:asparagine synthase B [Tenuibacillus multivorans]|uniref:asparagine synthase (glutamine-hydrolyzing) n=1 Tax=Tenuibacillus multivorans TaxID=237069 RepID=A0A1H0ETL4_9BACI|nr:asparagine synthase B [Tenuibacillus multivorans]GEL76958.1 asparagine synthase B [Tenuibacillus multivorans]SDN85734.1 asparagine synthase (glutamine-hydrolysing) [Tenuibacillus multivorans]